MAKIKLVAPKNLKIDFKPSPKQYEVWKQLQPECPICGGEVKLIRQKDGTDDAVCQSCGNNNIPQLVLCGGAAGGGKTFLASVWILTSCMNFSDIKAVIGRKTLKSLKESTLATMLSIMRKWGLEEDVHYTFNSVSGVMLFWNNSTVTLKDMADTLQDPNFERYGSSEFSIGYIEECSEISEKAQEVLFSRLRWNISNTFKVSKMLMSTNPCMGWVRDRFVQDKEGNRAVCRPGEAYIPFKVDDNPDKAFVAHYKRALQKLKDPATRERLLEGNWDYVDANDMAFYRCFDGAKHLEVGLKERVYDKTKPLLLSWDFNVFPQMSCLVMQIDYDKKEVYVIEELAGTPKKKTNNTPAMAKYTANLMKQRNHDDVIVITGDPAGLARSTQTADGVNNYSIIRNEFVGLHTQQKLLRIAPPQVLRGEWINEIFGENYEGWSILIDMRCRKLTEDLIYQLAMEDGSKDKSKVKDAKTGVRYEKYGHYSDCLDCALCLFLQKSWYKYKRGGNESSSPATAKITASWGY